MGGGGKIRKKRNQLSRIHAFSSGKTSFKGEHSLIGGPGFGRIVYCEEQESVVNYCDNYVRTTKYTMFTFIPKSLFEQFRRVANFYFLVCAILSFFPVSPYSAVSNVVPLVVVVAATVGKEAVEDWRRMKQVIKLLMFFNYCLGSILFFSVYLFANTNKLAYNLLYY
jgi:phospholipid-translocating ATPase